jgi:hypothetical protein
MGSSYLTCGDFCTFWIFMLILRFNLLILAKCSVEAFAISYDPQIIILDSAFMIRICFSIVTYISIQILTRFQSVDGITVYI